MHRFDGAVAHTLGIHRSDLRCLNELEGDGLTPGMIGARLGLTSGSVTALVDRLVRAGFVERRPDAADRRRSTIALTMQARRGVHREYARLGHAIAARMETFTPDERALLGRGLGELAAAFDEAGAAIEV